MLHRNLSTTLAVLAVAVGGLSAFAASAHAVVIDNDSAGPASAFIIDGPYTATQSPPNSQLELENALVMSSWLAPAPTVSPR